MNSVRSHRSLTTVIFRVLLPLLVLINLGSTPIAGGEAPAAACSPSITLTQKPLIGSQEEFLSGRVDCVNPRDYKVAVYIFLGGWWNKPTWAEPLTSINNSGTWRTDVTTAPSDYYAVTYAAFLLPNGVVPDQLGGQPNIPTTMFTKSVAYVIEARRTIEFSGRTWNVKTTPAAPYESPIGPGPNYFSADPNDVWVDASGNLHLTITHRNGKWYATEVYTTKPMGYGNYIFTLASPVDQLDKNAVLGLFAWDDTDPAYNHREIDIEYSRWGQAADPNSQYVVQPFDHHGNRHRFNTTLTGTFSTHRFKWEPHKILFASDQGELPNLGAQIQRWTYTGADLPPAGMGNARINLWLYNGLAPSNGQRIEVVVKAFRHPTVFSDIPDSYWAWSYIQSLYDASVTGGCNTNPLSYCPEGPVTRAQMAVFLLRAKHGPGYAPPPIGDPPFNDVPIDYWAAAWIEQLAAEGITSGCGGGNYCPEASVTRAQMAIFLLKAKHGLSYSPPAVSGSTGFGDVEPTHWAAAWIKQLVAEGITAGCGNGNYCPESLVTRAQMAVFLVRTFSLP